MLFFSPLALPPKFLPIPILQVLSLAFLNVVLFFFLTDALETAVMRVIQALSVDIIPGAEGY